jgi:hypothetical protein
MLLSRFWYLFLAVTAAAAVGAALLAQGIINRQSDLQVGDQLRRDRLELEAVLRLEARSRLDRVAFITVDGKIGEILKTAKSVSDPDKLWNINGQLKAILRGHIDRIAEALPGTGPLAERREKVAPAIVFAVDSGGRIIAQLGPLEMNKPGTGLGTFPLVRRAIQGYLRDDIWLYDRRVYRMAARPVIYEGEYVGAIVHGYRYDRAFAQTLSENLGDVTIAFFYGTDLLASYSPPAQTNAASEADLSAPLRDVIADAKFAKGERTNPIALKESGLAVYSLVNGSASAANVGYAIARPRKLLASPQALFENASSQDVRGLPFASLIGGAIALTALGLLFIFLERDMPLRRFVRKLTEIAHDERDRLIITQWRGIGRQIADHINQAIEKQVQKAAQIAPGARKKVNLDEILGPAPGEQDGFFAFAKGQSANAIDTLGGDTFPEPPPPDIPPPPPKPGSSVQAGSAPKPPPPRQRGKAVPPPPSAGFSPPPSASVGGRAAPPVADQAVPIATATIRDTVDESASEAFDEDQHFRQVYEQYIKTRKECGESVDGIEFEKFLVTVRKNRDQIIAKHNAKAARFTVYVKEGKAALKATPIKKVLAG